MDMEDANHYIRSVKLQREKVASFSEYPFNLPVIRELSEIELHSKVTYFVGENGTGKSTILEAIATSYGFIRRVEQKTLTFQLCLPTRICMIT
jgi:predicted ATPase